MNRIERVHVETLQRRADYLAERVAERRRVGQKFKLGDYEASELKATRWALALIAKADEFDLIEGLTRRPRGTYD